MRLIKRIFILALFLGLHGVSAFGQAQIEGQVYSMVYALENAESQQLWDYYQGGRIRIRPSRDSRLLFTTHLRVARRGDPADWQEKVYNAYMDWKSNAGDFQIKLGRQFIYNGVINGSVDGVLLRLMPVSSLDLRLIGGISAPYDRTLKIHSWDEGGLIGGYASYRFASLARIDVSYVQRTRQEEIAWRQLGTALTGSLLSSLYYQAQFEYNLEQSTYQGMRYRLTYQRDRWSLSGEYNNQKPRIYEDSFFNVFKLVAFNQLRGGATFQAGKVQLGGQLLHTIYEGDETNDEIILSAGTRWGSLGVVYQTGFGGDNLGIFGDIRYDISTQLEVRLRSSHYTYERRSIAINEDATAFSGGFIYRPIPALQLQAELQESLNTYYNQNLRALFRINYAFDVRPR